MTIAEITDVIQAIDLLLFGTAAVLSLMVAIRAPRYRWAMLPVFLYALNGTLFYIAATLVLFDGTTRMLWSASLRMQAISSMVVALVMIANYVRRQGER